MDEGLQDHLNDCLWDPGYGDCPVCMAHVNGADDLGEAIYAAIEDGHCVETVTEYGEQVVVFPLQVPTPEIMTWKMACSVAEDALRWELELYRERDMDDDVLETHRSIRRLMGASAWINRMAEHLEDLEGDA